MRIIYVYQVVDGMICIKEDEASVISLIYDMYFDGNSLKKPLPNFFADVLNHRLGKINGQHNI